MTQPPEPVSHDPAITAVLQRLEVPEHQPGFWDDLARAMAEPSTPPAPPALPERHEVTPGSRSRRRLVLVAVAAAVIVAVAAALVRDGLDDARIQTVDSGPSPTVTVPVPVPSPTAVVTSPPDGAGPATVQVQAVTADDMVGPSAAGWFFSDDVTWSDGGFVALPDGGQSEHWTSPDGVDWRRHDGSTPALVHPFDCPDRFDCEVAPAGPPIPFHFARPAYRLVARAGDLVVLNAWTQYASQQEPTGSGEVAPGAVVHPDLLAAAAAADPCFEELRRQAEAGEAPSADPGKARFTSWSGGGMDNPVIQLSCAGPSLSATFTLDLRDHLSPDQIRAVYSTSAVELWMARPGEPPERVDDPPTATIRAGGIPMNQLVTGLAPVVSSGSRLWAVDEGVLVSSADGVTWVPQAGPATDQKVAEVKASPGGHLALRLADDPTLPPTTAWFTVSHDDGATWSAPMVATGRLEVGPSGALVVDDSTEQATASLLDGGRVQAAITFAPGTYVRRATVGDGRILVLSVGPPSSISSSPDTSTMLMSVYDADGQLLRQLVYDEGTTSRRLLWPAVALLAAVTTLAAAAIVVLVRRRLRSVGRDA